MDEKYTPLKRIIEYSDPQMAETAGDYMIFGRGGIERDYKFSKKERMHDIFFRKNTIDKEITAYLLPAKYKTVHLPKDKNISGEFEDFTRIYRGCGGKITETQIRQEKRIKLPAEKYNEVVDYYNRLSNETKERIIIKKN